MKVLAFWFTFFLAFYSEATETQSQLIQQNGEPLRIHFKDGRVAVFVVKKWNNVFKPNLTLSENSCTITQTAHCKGSFPYIARQFGILWEKHPTKQGSFTLRNDYTNTSKMVINVIGTAEFPLYSQVKYPDSDYGQIECDTTDWVPWNSGDKGNRKGVITYWDDDLEKLNKEIGHEYQHHPSVSSFTSRVEELPIQESNNKILFGVPEHAFDNLNSQQYGFPFLAYHSQLTFISKNLIDPKNKICEVKFNLDFNKIFEHFVKLLNTFKPADFNPKDFVPLIYNSKNYQYLPQWWKNPNAWLNQNLE